jgi:hypothetical protein
MPYVKRGAGFRRGMGYTPNTTCAAGSMTDRLCSTGAFDVAFQTPCNICPSTQPIPAPSLQPGSVSPSLPTGYDTSTGVIDLSSNPSGSTEPNAYAPSYPSNPGSAGQATGACDWTQAAWLDPSTWCGANWAMAGIVGLGLLLFLKGGR